MSGDAGWYRVLSTAPDPEARVRDLSDDGLDAAIRELIAIPAPNAYQADLGATCMAEAVKRWAAGIPKPMTTEF